MNPKDLFNRILNPFVFFVLALVVQTSAAFAQTGEQGENFVQVTLSDGANIFVAKHETSVELWRKCVDAGYCFRPADLEHKLDDMPITGVNIGDVQAYIDWINSTSKINYRLPTQPEWLEIAANHRPRKKKKLFTQPELAWAADYDIEAEPMSNVVREKGSFGVNLHGVSDLKGNVWEWTSSECGDEDLVDFDFCFGHLAVGEHVAVLSPFVRNPGKVGCFVGQPPANVGFRVVY